MSKKTYIIYEITCGPLRYVGVTMQCLKERFRQHKYNYIKNLKKSTSVKLFQYGNDNNISIEIHEIDRSICTKKIALIIERLYQDKFENVNKCFKSFNDKFLERKQNYQKNKEQICKRVNEYRKKNIDKIKIQKKKYCDNNKEKISKKLKQYYGKNKEKLSKKIQCPKCNSFLRKSDIKRHQKTIKCLYLNKLQ